MFEEQVEFPFSLSIVHSDCQLNSVVKHLRDLLNTLPDLSVRAFSERINSADKTHPKQE